MYSRTIVFSGVSAQIEEAAKRFAAEHEKFYELQVQDEIILLEKINILAGNVVNMTLQTDIDRVHETASEAKRIGKLMKEYREKGLLLNKRQALFGKEVMVFDQLDELMEKFEPYLTLWVTASGNRILIRERVTRKPNLPSLNTPRKEYLDIYSWNIKFIFTDKRYIPQINV